MVFEAFLALGGIVEGLVTIPPNNGKSKIVGTPNSRTFPRLAQNAAEFEFEIQISPTIRGEGLVFVPAEGGPGRNSASDLVFVPGSRRRDIKKKEKRVFSFSQP